MVSNVCAGRTISALFGVTPSNATSRTWRKRTGLNEVP
jgi:hypothetical protein